MYSSVKALFTPDVNCGLTTTTTPQMRVDAALTNCLETSFRDLTSGTDSRFFPNRGLGIIFPHASVSLQETTNLSVSSGTVSDGLASVLCRTPETPSLEPWSLNDEISPILPLPPPLYHVVSPIKRSKSLLPTAEMAPLSTRDVDQIETEADITSMVLNDNRFVREDSKIPLFSPVPDAPTVDIAEYGMSCEPSPQTGINNATKSQNKCSPLCDNVRLPIILSTIPIYHRKLRDDNFSSSTTPTSYGSTHPKPLASHAAVGRSSVTCGYRRSAHRTRQPIETRSPSMTPSPTNSPKLYRLPIYRKDSDRKTMSLKRFSLEPVVSDTPSKTSSFPSSASCVQHTKRRFNVHESIRTYTRCSPWKSPTCRSPLFCVLACSFGTLSQSTQGDSDTTTPSVF